MFNEEEIGVLFKALDALERAQVQDHMMGVVMGAMLIRDEEERDEFMEKKEAELAAEQKAAQVQTERIILLKAKLISMRDKAEIDLLSMADLNN